MTIDGVMILWEMKWNKNILYYAAHLTLKYT